MFCCVDGCRMVDHDRRRKTMMMMRKQRSVGREGIIGIHANANQEIGTQINIAREYFDDGDLNDILYDLILYHTLTAKAA